MESNNSSSTQHRIIKFKGPENWKEAKHAVQARAYELDAMCLLDGPEPPTSELLAANKKLYVYITEVFTSSPAFIYIEDIKHGEVFLCWQALTSVYESDSRAGLMERFRAVMARRQGGIMAEFI